MFEFPRIHGTPKCASLAMDALAPLLITRALPFLFEIASTAEDLKAVYHLRYHAAVSRGWVNADDFAEELEQDIHESRSVSIAVWDETSLVATVRLVMPMAGFLLPTEQEFDLRIHPEGEVVDIGRLVIASGYSDHGHRVALGLLGQTWLIMRSLGFSQACGILTRSMERLYRHVGLHVTRLGPARRYWGEDRFPVLAPTEVFERMSDRWDLVHGDHG